MFSGVLVFAFGGAAVGKLVRQKQQVMTAEKLTLLALAATTAVLRGAG